jgi:hypothetical protein
MALGAAVATLLRLACAPRAAAFARALARPADAQSTVLGRITRLSAGTEYGRMLGLRANCAADDYRARVPIADYDRLRPWIEQQRAKGGPVLTPGRTRCYEPTSGSGGPAKSIPYNDALLASFRALFSIWTHDLLANALRLRSAKTFISASSPVRGREGFADDSQYLGNLMRLVLGRFLVLPPRMDDPGAFRDALALALVAEPDLEIISVWNPSYLLILLEHFEEHRGRLCGGLPPSRRAVLLREPLCWRDVWPSLQLLSCWREGAAEAPARRLVQLFPHARLQGKGLLATEAPVTVPLVAAQGCVPLVDEVFMELEDEQGRSRLLHEAQAGERYALIISHGGGLLRYRLGDRVHVAGWYLDTPILAFAGRADSVADLVGEKLDEALVGRVLRILAPAGAFCTLVPVLPEEGRPYYRLLTDQAQPDLAAALDHALMESFRYREARMLGQLEAVRVTCRSDMRRTLHDALVASGMKAGDIKDRALLTSLELSRRIAPRCTA